MLIYWVLGLLALLLLLAWRPARPITALVAAAIGLLGFSALGPAAPLLKLVLWLAWAGLVALRALPEFRRALLSEPLARLARRQLPQISAAEQAAIAAGSVGWEGQLFSGKPDWHQLLALPTPELSPQEQAFLDGPVERFCAMLDEWQICHELADLPAAAWDFLKREGFFGLEIPTECGGQGFSAGAHAAILRRIASAPAGMVASSIVAVPNSLGPAALLLKYGTEEQKQHYLPALARGEHVPCFALTSAAAGSDAGAIEDEGIVCKGEWQGQEITGIRLNWDKRYITLAPVATLIGLAFRLRDPERLLGDDPEPGISCALIPAELPGVESGRRHLPLNAPFMNGPTRGRDVFVPLDALIGGPEMAGQGWRMLMESLATGRGISLPAGSSGMLQAMARHGGAYARLRRQFGLPVGSFEGVGEALGRLGGRAYAARALSRFVAGAVDLGERPAVANAIAKLQATELMRSGAAEAMDIHAGKAVMLGPNNWLGRTWQAAPVYITVEGANILTRSMMIYGQGALRAHPYLRGEVEALQQGDVEGFETLCAAHAGHLCSVLSRSLVHALTGSLLAAAPDSPAARHYQRLARYSAAFAVVSDASLLSLGPALKRAEALSGRLADALSWLYIASASLKQFEEGERALRPALDWTCQEAYWRIELALDGVLRHLPSRLLAAVIRLVVFPLGRHARPAGDRELLAIAGQLQTPGPERDALSPDAWTCDVADHPIGRLETCLRDVSQVDSLQQRLQRAQADGQLAPGTSAGQRQAAAEAGIINAAEAELLADFEQRLSQVLAVDEFDDTELARPPAKPPRRPGKAKP